MSVFQFGSGTLIGTPVSGNLAANPTPMKFGTLQDVTLEISFDQKELYGQNQFPDAIARGKGKITGKAKFANINAKLFNDLFWGLTVASGQTTAAINEAGTVPTTPFQITVVNAATFLADLGVVYSATGFPLTRVVSGPTVGQYSVNVGTGVYTFAAADTTAAVLITYEYNVPASGKTTAITTQLMGFAPVFQIDLIETYNTNQSNIRLYSCMASKLTRSTKQDDFVVPELDFNAFANAAGKVIDFYDAV